MGNRGQPYPIKSTHGRGLPKNGSADFRALNPHVFKQLSDLIDVLPPGTDGFPGGPEEELQMAAERMIESYGFIRLTSGNAERQAGTEIPGWFGHMNNAFGNPFMPDLFVYAAGKPALLVELKTRNKFGIGQQEMIAAGWWQLARTMDEFSTIFMKWMNG